MAELRSLKNENDKFNLIAISVDPAERSLELKRKVASDGKGAIGFPLLSDPTAKTINAFGLYDPAYAGKEFEGIPRSAVIIVDKNRKVVWANVSTDYKRRPTNADIRAALKDF